MLQSNHDKQAIAPFLIILRVANRSTLASNTVASGDLDSIRFESGGQSTGDDGTFPDWTLASSTQVGGEAPGDLGVVVESNSQEVPLEGSS